MLLLLLPLLFCVCCSAAVIISVVVVVHVVCLVCWRVLCLCLCCLCFSVPGHCCGSVFIALIHHATTPNCLLAFPLLCLLSPKNLCDLSLPQHIAGSLHALPMPLCPVLDRSLPLSPSFPAPWNPSLPIGRCWVMAGGCRGGCCLGGSGLGGWLVGGLVGEVGEADLSLLVSWFVGLLVCGVVGLLVYRFVKSS